MKFPGTAAVVMVAAILLPHYLHHLPLPENLLRINAKILDNSPLRDDQTFPKGTKVFRVQCKFNPQRLHSHVGPKSTQ